MNEVLDVLPTEQTNLIKEHDSHSVILEKNENKQEPILEQTLEPKLEQTLEPKLEQTLEPKLEQTLEPKLEQTLEPKLEQTLEPKLEQTLEPKLEQQKPQLVNRSNSQEVRDFISRYGDLQKKNSLLIKGRKKRFDSADYFEAKAKIKKISKK